MQVLYKGHLFLEYAQIILYLPQGQSEKKITLSFGSGGVVLWGRAGVGGEAAAPLVSHHLWAVDLPATTTYQYEVKSFAGVIICNHAI